MLIISFNKESILIKICLKLIFADAFFPIVQVIYKKRTER